MSARLCLLLKYNFLSPKLRWIMVSCHLSRTSTVTAFHHGFCFKGMNAFDECASQKVSLHILYYDIYLKLSIFTLVFQGFRF